MYIYTNNNNNDNDNMTQRCARAGAACAGDARRP